MNEEKMKEVFSDEGFVKSLLQLETPKEVQAALEEKDIGISIAEIKQIAEMLRKKANGELTDEELENVAGGTNVFTPSVFYFGQNSVPLKQEPVFQKLINKKIIKLTC